MSEDHIIDVHNLEAICKVETLLEKIQNAIKSYHYGLWPAEILAVKIEEFSYKLNREILGHE